MIDDRKIELITRLVDEYISTAHPVGSLFLVERYQLTWSSATIRNEMALLEEQGLMYQPYTSAGRVPTQQGYRLYIQYMKPARISSKQAEQLTKTTETLEDTTSSELKKLCRTLADISGEVAFIRTETHCLIAGMQNLSEKPEFANAEFMGEIVSVLDNLDELLQNIQNELSEEPKMFIGDEEHFSKQCSVFALAVSIHNERVVIGLIGPIRMNYGKNNALLQTLSTLLSN